MIIIGYPGIGKTTLANTDARYIDLESSLFGHDRGWIHTYARVASNLSKQGYIVFVSAHGELQDELRGSKQRVVVIHPALELREDWTMKLRHRFADNPEEQDKNFRAYVRACDDYETDIKALATNGFERYEIDNMYYSLKDIISNICEKE
jgi:hypothetical protein